MQEFIIKSEKKGGGPHEENRGYHSKSQRCRMQQTADERYLQHV